MVLVLLVIAGSLVIPAITGAFDSVRLQRSADVVIARWSEARAQAIETGVPYQFLFTPETGNYRVERWAQPTGSGSGPTAVATASTEPVPDNALKTLAEAGSIVAALPETVQFLSGQEAVEDAHLRERRVSALQTPGSTWSTPILFFPDGSSSTATVVLQNDARQFVRLTLRGLTGTARSSGVLIREEMDQGGQAR